MHTGIDAGISIELPNNINDNENRIEWKQAPKRQQQKSIKPNAHSTHSLAHNDGIITINSINVYYVVYMGPFTSHIQS